MPPRRLAGPLPNTSGQTSPSRRPRSARPTHAGPTSGRGAQPRRAARMRTGHRLALHVVPRHPPGHRPDGTPCSADDSEGRDRPPVAPPSTRRRPPVAPLPPGASALPGPGASGRTPDATRATAVSRPHHAETRRDPCICLAPTHPMQAVPRARRSHAGLTGQRPAHPPRLLAATATMRQALPRPDRRATPSSTLACPTDGRAAPGRARSCLMPPFSAPSVSGPPGSPGTGAASTGRGPG